jgi:hypothetical protein
VSLIVNNEEHLLRALADTGASSSIILEAYTSASLINTDQNNTTTWSTMSGKFTTTKTRICLWHFHSQSSTSRNKCVILGYFMLMTDDRSESSSPYEMIMGRDILGELGIFMNFDDYTLTWDTDTIPMEKWDTCTSSSIEALIEVYMSANEPQTLRDEYSWATKILDAEYKPASLDDVIKTCENLHVVEQHQLKILLQNMNISLMKH